MTALGWRRRVVARRTELESRFDAERTQLPAQGGAEQGTGRKCLPATPDGAIVTGMFVVSESDAAAIRATFEQEGELSAAIELRRRFPGIVDNAKARSCARAIAGWTPLPEPPAKVVRLRPRKKGC